MTVAKTTARTTNDEATTARVVDLKARLAKLFAKTTSLKEQACKGDNQTATLQTQLWESRSAQLRVAQENEHLVAQLAVAEKAANSSH